MMTQEERKHWRLGRIVEEAWLDVLQEGGPQKPESASIVMMASGFDRMIKAIKEGPERRPPLSKKAIAVIVGVFLAVGATIAGFVRGLFE